VGVSVRLSVGVKVLKGVSVLIGEKVAVDVELGEGEKVAVVIGVMVGDEVETSVGVVVAEKAVAGGSGAAGLLFLLQAWKKRNKPSKVVKAKAEPMDFLNILFPARLID